MIDCLIIVSGKATPNRLVVQRAWPTLIFYDFRNNNALLHTVVYFWLSKKTKCSLPCCAISSRPSSPFFHISPVEWIICLASHLHASCLHIQFPWVQRQPNTQTQLHAARAGQGKYGVPGAPLRPPPGSETHPGQCRRARFHQDRSVGEVGCYETGWHGRWARFENYNYPPPLLPLFFITIKLNLICTRVKIHSGPPCWKLHQVVHFKQNL